MRVEYENVLDDHLGKLHFTFVTICRSAHSCTLA